MKTQLQLREQGLELVAVEKKDMVTSTERGG